MAFDAGGRIDLAVNPVLEQIVTPMRQGALRRILVFVTRLNLFATGVAVIAEIFLVTRCTYLAVLCGKIFMPCIEVILMIQFPIGIGVTFGAVG